MAKKISDLTAISGGVFSDNDLFEVSVDTGGGSYVSRKILGSEVKTTIGGANIGNSDLTINTSGARKLILGGALSTDSFTIRNSADSADYFKVNGVGQVFSYGKGSGSTNLAYGDGALNSNVSSSGMTVFGHNAGAGIVSGNGYSTYIGWYAGNKSTGIQNTAVGFNAFLNSVSGLHNTALGYGALQNASGANYNVALGHSSGLNLTTGSANVGLGYFSLRGVTTGALNLMIGQSGTTGTGVTTGSYNTIIGNDVTGLGNVSNNIVIADGQGKQVIRKDANGNQILGEESALATTATNGFTYIPSGAGTPTGTPTSVTGKVPMYYDDTNQILYIYSGGAWNAH